MPLVNGVVVEVLGRMLKRRYATLVFLSFCACVLDLDKEKSNKIQRWSKKVVTIKQNVPWSGEAIYESAVCEFDAKTKSYFIG